MHNHQNHQQQHNLLESGCSDHHSKKLSGCHSEQSEIEVRAVQAHSQDHHSGSCCSAVDAHGLDEENAQLGAVPVTGTERFSA